MLICSAKQQKLDAVFGTLRIPPLDFGLSKDDEKRARYHRNRGQGQEHPSPHQNICLRCERQSPGSRSGLKAYQIRWQVQEHGGKHGEHLSQSVLNAQQHPSISRRQIHVIHQRAEDLHCANCVGIEQHHRQNALVPRQEPQPDQQKGRNVATNCLGHSPPGPQAKVPSGDAIVPQNSHWQVEQQLDHWRWRCHGSVLKPPNSNWHAQSGIVAKVTHTSHC